MTIRHTISNLLTTPHTRARGQVIGSVVIVIIIIIAI